MPDLELRNGSTATIMQPDGTQREANAQRVTISSDAVPNRLGYNINELTNSLSQAMSSIGYTSQWGAINDRQVSEESLKRYIKQFNYIPERFQFHKLSDEEELYLGIELEIDNGGEEEVNAQYVCDYMNSATENVYCKHDGSLSRGFEIVTHPCTIEYHKQLKYEELFKELIKRGYRSHDVSTCGLHVHINRNYFGEKKLDQDLNISKLLYLYEKFWDKVELVARRKSNGYARRFYLEEDESPIDLYVKSKEANKYGAINLKHKNTIEIRIFKGTLKVDTYFNTLEFVSVMAHMAKETDIYDIQFVTWDKIISRFSDELNQYIADREETVKNEEKEKVNDMMSNRSSAISYGSLSSPASFEYGRTMSGSFDISLSEEQRMTFINAMNNISIPSLRSEPIAQPSERTEEDILMEQIQELKVKVRRSRNGLEITNLNRQIAELENKLRRLRQSNRNR